MMKWGGRKHSSSSSSSSSHASPFSWLFKFKQMKMNSDPNPNKVMKQKAKQNSTSIASPPPQYSDGNNNGDRLCGGNDHDGAFWTQSFDEASQEDKKSKDTYENVVISSSRINAKKHGRRQGTLKLKDGGGLEDERKLMNDDKNKVLMQVDEYDREQEYENIRRRFERKAQQVLEEQLLKLEREAKEVEFASSKAVEEDVLQFESPRTICTPRTHSFVSSAELKNSSLRNVLEDRVFSTTNNSFEKTERLSQKKLRQSEELKVKTEKQKSPHQRIRKPKIRIYSPRMVSKVEVCRIKALEDMRKAAKLKMKKEREEIVEETRPGLDSFAVIKCSLDPKQDFRDSMIEMINEKQISQPEEMEELLACYLTLNADEYHDLIIKVFRQVWFDMSQHGLGIKSNTPWGCYE